jgi:hypothetical protein
MRFEPMPSFAHLGEARLKALAGYMLQQAAQTPPARTSGRLTGQVDGWDR